MATEHYSFQAKDILDRFVQRWMWVVALGILGALVGLLISIVLPAKYEAAASILMNFEGRIANLFIPEFLDMYLRVDNNLILNE